MENAAIASHLNFFDFNRRPRFEPPPPPFRARYNLEGNHPPFIDFPCCRQKTNPEFNSTKYNTLVLFLPLFNPFNRLHISTLPYRPSLHSTFQLIALIFHTRPFAISPRASDWLRTHSLFARHTLPHLRIFDLVHTLSQSSAPLPCSSRQVDPTTSSTLSKRTKHSRFNERHPLCANLELASISS